MLYLVAVVVIIMLCYSLFNHFRANKKQEENFPTEVRSETAAKTFIERPLVPKQEEIDLTGMQEIGRNKRLYPSDNFGKMEHGVVDNGTSKKERKKKKRIRFLE